MRKFSWMLLVLLASVSLVHSGPWTRGNSDYYKRNNPSVKSESSELVDDTVKKEIVATAERDARNNVSAFKWWCSGCLFGGIALSWADRLEPSMPKNDFSGMLTWGTAASSTVISILRPSANRNQMCRTQPLPSTLSMST